MDASAGLKLNSKRIIFICFLGRSGWGCSEGGNCVQQGIKGKTVVVKCISKRIFSSSYKTTITRH